MLLLALYKEDDWPCVVVLNNNFIHVDKVIVSTIKAKGHIVHFLPPYFLNFNLIKLMFLVLKA
jgi:hypothetical protein